MKTMYGINTPLLTLFDTQGNIDFKAMTKHIDFLIAKGVHKLYPMGTIGEGTLMTLEERKSLAEQIVNYVDHRVGVFIHIGALSQKDAVDLASHAERIGADGVGAVSPFFYHVSQTDIYYYFLAISESVSDNFPVYLYNLPDMAGNDITTTTVAELAKRPNIMGIKNTMPTTYRIHELLCACPENFNVISGDDMVAFTGLALGAAGVVSGTSNIFPEILLEMYRCVQQNDLSGAAAAQKKVYEIARILNFNFKPSAMKAILEMRGFKRSYSRQPLEPFCSEQEYSFIYQSLKKCFSDTDYIL